MIVSQSGLGTVASAPSGSADDIRVREFLASPNYSKALKALGAVAAAKAEGGGQRGGRALRVALGGNCNLDFMKPALSVAFDSEGFAPTLTSVEFDGWIQGALSGKYSTDWWIIWLSAIGFSRGGQERGSVDLGAIGEALRAIEARGESSLVVLPEALAWEDDPFSPFLTWRKEIIDGLAKVRGAAVFLPVEHLQRSLGNQGWRAPRYWATAKCPCHPNAVARLGVEVARTIALAIRPRVKAVAVDLDNTLWGGIVGDDGPEGLELDGNGEGRPYLEMQRFLIDVSQSGIPLSVVSKNDPVQAARPFDECPEMLLKRSDFIHFMASWGRKHEAIKAIAANLNIGVDSICFIDDSPQERDEARNFLPGLIVPDLPEDPDDRVPFLLASGLFGAPVRRDEDLRRVEMYRQEAKRNLELAGSSDVSSYLRSLQMRLIVRPMTKDSLSRAASLLQKTNQFNVTNRRGTGQYLAEMGHDPRAYARSFALKDRFGEMGIVGVLAARLGDRAVEIEEWVLSCRAFSRGVEDAMFEHVVNWAKSQGTAALETSFIRTDKNGMIETLLPRLGFELTGGGGGGGGGAQRWHCREPQFVGHALVIEANGAPGSPQ